MHSVCFKHLYVWSSVKGYTWLWSTCKFFPLANVQSLIFAVKVPAELELHVKSVPFNSAPQCTFVRAVTEEDVKNLYEK